MWLAILYLAHPGRKDSICSRRPMCVLCDIRLLAWITEYFTAFGSWLLWRTVFTRSSNWFMECWCHTPFKAKSHVLLKVADKGNDLKVKLFLNILFYFYWNPKAIICFPTVSPIGFLHYSGRLRKTKLGFNGFDSPKVQPGRLNAPPTYSHFLLYRKLAPSQSWN